MWGYKSVAFIIAISMNVNFVRGHRGSLFAKLLDIINNKITWICGGPGQCYNFNNKQIYVVSVVFKGFPRRKFTLDHKQIKTKNIYIDAL